MPNNHSSNTLSLMLFREFCRRDLFSPKFKLQLYSSTCMFFLRGRVLFCPSSCGNQMCEGSSLQTNCCSNDYCEDKHTIKIFNYKPWVPPLSGGAVVLGTAAWWPPGLEWVSMPLSWLPIHPLFIAPWVSWFSFLQKLVAACEIRQSIQRIGTYRFSNGPFFMGWLPMGSEAEWMISFQPLFLALLTWLTGVLEFTLTA